MGWKQICNECGADKYEDISYLGKNGMECLKCGSHNVREINKGGK